MVNLITSTLQMEKRCIFCGAPPSNKNREHVIPKWLIELTGDPKRQWYLGVKFGEPDKPARQFAADQFQFPACESCNTRYSALERRTHKNMAAILDRKELSASQWLDVLDWFDKVRVGLFIGNMILNKDLPIPDPKFFIDQRLRAKDRCLFVYPIQAENVGLRMIGAGDPVFFHMPTSFMLLVNDLLFVNLSSDFLLAPRLGFPFPRTMRTEGVRTYASDYTATFRSKTPVVRFPFYRPALQVYQAILAKELFPDDEYGSLVRNDYVQSRLISEESTETKCCTLEDGQLSFLAPSDRVTWDAQSPVKSFDDLCVRHLEFRQRELEKAVESSNAFGRKLARLMMKFNNYAMEQTKSAVYSL